MPQPPVVRFAPSPNGYLHLGHALSALFSYRVAEALGARFLVRIEDIDQGRARPAFVDQILDDLAWLGLEWEEPVRVQSEHMSVYADARDRLEARNLLYPCALTRKALVEAVERYEASGERWPRDPDGSPLLPAPGGVRMPATDGNGTGDPAARRLDCAAALGRLDEPLTFIETGPGRPARSVDARPEKWGDIVLARKDIGTSYHLSVVVDDALQGVTHVTRGTDLFEATHLHSLLQRLLELPAPTYIHHPLITDREGRKLSKSRHAKSLMALRAEGVSVEEIRARTGIDRFNDYFEGLADRLSTSARETA